MDGVTRGRVILPGRIVRGDCHREAGCAGLSDIMNLEENSSCFPHQLVLTSSQCLESS